jgi:alanine-synthesizing transaminase
MFASRTNWRLEPNRLAQALERHRRGGKPLFDLTASNPTACGFAYPEAEILAALADPRVLRYVPEAKGLREAREAVAAYYRGRPGFAASAPHPDPERILLVSGTSEGYSHVFRLLCEPGDEILVPAPSYPLFEFLASLADVRLVPYGLLYDHGWQIDLGSLRAALTPRARAVLVVHPNNPTGSLVKPREAAELAEICARREMAVVADEVFLDYAGSSVAAPTFACDSAALTFTLSGLSKTCALPQMKLAWMVVTGPESSARAAVDRLEVIADTYLSPSVPVQLATAKFLALRETMARQLQERIAANLAYLDGALRASDSIRRLEREGGWYAILRVPAPDGDEALAVALLEQCSVLVHPGIFFNFAQDGFLVVSLITPAPEFQEAVRRLQQFFGEE